MFWVVDKTFAEKCAERDAEDAERLRRRNAELERRIKELEQQKPKDSRDD